MNIALLDADFLNFVEFNLTGDNDDFHRCDSESRYMDTGVFNLFQSCFENASKTYDYFAGTRYNSRTIIVLRNELSALLVSAKSVTSKDAFASFINSRFLGSEFLLSLEEEDPDWQQHWHEIHDKIMQVLNDLIELVEKCAFEERVLWVIGY
jgi:hypothetical protein